MLGTFHARWTRQVHIYLLLNCYRSTKMFTELPLVSLSKCLPLMLLLCGTTLCYGAHDCVTNTSLWSPVPTATIGLFDGDAYPLNLSHEVLQTLSLSAEHDIGLHITFEGCNLTVECESVAVTGNDLVELRACDMTLPPLVNMTLNSISNSSCDGSENSTSNSSYIALSTQLPGIAFLLQGEFSLSCTLASIFLSRHAARNGGTRLPGHPP